MAEMSRSGKAVLRDMPFMMLILAAASILSPTVRSGMDGPVDVLPSFSQERFERMLARHSDGGPWIVPTLFPEDLTADARFGMNILFGDHNISWILDRQQLYLDANGNGNLRDDEPIDLSGGAAERTFSVRVTRDDGTTGIYPVQMKFRLSDRGPGMLRVESDAVREGTVEVPGGSVPFLVIGNSGSFSGATVVFDLDGDGEFDLDDPMSLERFSFLEEFVNLRGRTYQIEIAPDGGALTLTPAAVQRPERLRVVPGTQVPEVTVRTTTGESISIVPRNGTPALIYFWSSRCGGWGTEAPKIASLAARSDRGYDVIGVNTADEAQDFVASVAEFALRTPQIREMHSGLLNRLFRIDSIPRYVLIDGDGVIRSVRLTSSDYHQEILDELQK